MPRTTSSTLLAALQARDLRPAIFVQIQFLSAIVRLWSGAGSVTWNGQTWIGIGSLLGVSVIEDAATVEARGIAITLSGLDASLLAGALSDFKTGLPASVLFGAYSGGSLIATPIVSWSGRTDIPEISYDGETATITIACENRLSDSNIPVDRRYTNQDQQMTWPGDLCFQFVDGLQEMTLFIGGQANTTNNI